MTALMITALLLAQSATGRFESYCDGFGFFLARVDGAPVGRLLLFLHAGYSRLQPPIGAEKAME